MATCPITPDEITALVANRQPETCALEFKELLSLGSDSEKFELLKDVTGMANGGGGMIVIGVSTLRDPALGGEDRAAQLTPMTAAIDTARVNNILRSNTSPPVECAVYTIALAEGQYLAVLNVTAPAVGLVSFRWKKEARYYRRGAASVDPMTEAEIRESYVLLGQQQNARGQRWAKKDLPMTPRREDVATLTVSYVPYGHDEDLYRPSEVDWTSYFGMPLLDSFSYRITPHRMIRQLLYQSERGTWADGYFAEDSSMGRVRALRSHRDGSAGFLQEIYASAAAIENINEMVVVTLKSAADLAEITGVTGYIELVVRVDNVTAVRLSAGPGSFEADNKSVVMPVGVSRDQIELRVPLLSCARFQDSLVRNEIAHEILERIINGAAIATPLSDFDTGSLYTCTGNAVGAITTTGVVTGTRVRGVLDDKGYLSQNSLVRGRVVRGALLDANGDTVARTTFAYEEGAAAVPPLSVGVKEGVIPVLPEGVEIIPSGKWSVFTIDQVLMETV